MKKLDFYQKNLIRLKELSLDCAQCIQEGMMCHHLDYVRDYIKELEALPPLDEVKFEQFYKAYPRKAGRKYAFKVWMKMKIDDALFDIIMKAVEAQKTSTQWQENKGKFIPHPSTWLNGERWLDELDGVETEADKLRKEEREKKRLEFYKKNGYYPLS